MSDVIPIAGVLPSPFCHQDWQSTYEAMMAVTRVPFPDNLGKFTQGPTPPKAEDRDKAWLNTSQVRWYWWDINTSKWISPHPIAPGKILQIWEGTEEELKTYDGGNTATLSPTNGPFWVIATEFAGFAPVGVGKIGGVADGTDLALNATTGEEFFPVLIDHQHGFGVMHSDVNSDANWADAAKSIDAGALRAQTPGVTIPDDQAYAGIIYDAAYKDAIAAGASKIKKCTFVTTKQLAQAAGTPDEESKVQPSRGVYFIRRTSRLFYTM